VTEVAAGWSIKKKFLGKTVYNEDKKKVGKIEDVIIAPDGRASYVIIGAGGFVGVGRHDVAIPAGDLTEQDDKLVLPGATKEAIKAMPKFVYAKK
jgi:sporulation protein YlmC with PRC-barrel domain